MSDKETTTGQKPEIIFTLTIDAQDMRVGYRPDEHFPDYARFDFYSPDEPKRPIPVSETGYRSYFFPMRPLRYAPSVEAYAHAVALMLMNATPEPDDDTDELANEPQQLALF